MIMKNLKTGLLSLFTALALTLSLLPALTPAAAAALLTVGAFDIPANIAAPVAGQSGYRSFSGFENDQFSAASGTAVCWYTLTNGSYTLWDSAGFPETRFDAQTVYYLGLPCAGKNGCVFDPDSISDYRLDGSSAVSLLLDEGANGSSCTLLFPYPKTGDRTENTVIASLDLPAVAPPAAGQGTARDFAVGSGQPVELSAQENGWYTRGADGSYTLVGLIDKNETEWQGSFSAGTVYYLGINFYARAGYVFTNNSLDAYRLGSISAVDCLLYYDNSAAKLYWPFPAAAAKEISAVAVTVSVPAAGALPADSAAVAADDCYVAAVSWEPQPAGSFEADTAYTVVLSLEPSGVGSVFSKDVAVTVNGSPAAIVSGAGSDSLRASYTFAAAAAAKRFADVPKTAYFAGAVDWAVERKITAGTSDTTFSPDVACTRAQTVVFLWRAESTPAPDGAANPFADVSSDAYYCSAVLWAAQKGVTGGTSATAFSPEASVTRAAFVTFLWRAAGRPTVSGAGSFTDVTDPSAYYYNAVAWAVSKGITTGSSATTFSPDAPCTRAQVVTFLSRYFK